MTDASLRAVRGATLALAAATGLWALALTVFDGFTITLFALRLRSHDPFRPLIISAIAFVIYLRLGGREAPWLRSLVQASRSAIGALARQWRAGRLQDAAAVVLAVSVVTVGIAFASTSAGVSDQYGYLTDVSLWMEGRRSISQPWVADVPWPNASWSFSPLAFAPARNDPSAIVPITSPGYPLLMAGARMIGGACGPFWIVPIGGGLLL